MISIIAEIIAWVATFFRCIGMIANGAKMVKYLVSVGNLCWMINGIMTGNIPLIVSNAVCLAVMLYEIVVELIKTHKNVNKRRNTQTKGGA